MSRADMPPSIASDGDWQCQALRQAMAEVSDAVLLFDTPSGGILYANASAERVYGYSADELLSADYAALLADPSRAAADLQEAVRQAGTVRQSGLHRRCDGTEFPVEITRCALALDGRTVVCGVVRDVSERVARIRQLGETKRRRWLTCLGTLAEEVAHELNNLLTVILGNVELLAARAEAGQTESLQYIENAARRAGRLGEQLLRYGGRARLSKEPTDLGVMVAELQPALEGLLAGGSTLVCAIEGDLPLVHADRAEIGDVLQGLVARAAEAVEGSQGTVSLRVHAGQLAADPLAELMCSGGLPDGTYVMVDVADNGPALSDEDLTRLFDASFRTDSKQSSLPLGVMIGVIRAHGGGVAADSTPNQGTVIRLFLPAAGAAAVAEPEPQESVAAAPGTSDGGTALFVGTVLLADDEAPVRSLARKILVRGGFNVVEAANGHEALDLFREYADRLVAAVLDLAMPGLDGAEVLTRFRTARADLPVVLCSGYEKNQVISRIAEGPATAFLHKPYRAEDLLDLLHQILQPKA